MATDLEASKVDGQSPDAEQADPSSTNRAGQESVESTGAQSQQADSAEGNIGPKDLPPELEETRKQLMRDYHEKLRANKEDKIRFEKEMEKLKGESSTLQQLMHQEWFRKAAESERARRSGSVVELGLTDEEFSAATTDKAAFSKLVHKIADQVASAKVGKVDPELERTRTDLKELKLEREFESVASKYKDFRGLNDSGALDPYLEKGFDFETAYARYRLDHERSYSKDAPVDPKLKDAGTVNPGGMTRVNGQRVIKAKNLDEALDLAFAAIQSGEKDFKMEKVK